MRSTEVLVVGAGPFGLSVAAHAKGCGMDAQRCQRAPGVDLTAQCIAHHAP
jgi:cation diffusion facilitator CzcD-associated flavoprotein CzcO